MTHNPNTKGIKWWIFWTLLGFLLGFATVTLFACGFTTVDASVDLKACHAIAATNTCSSSAIRGVTRSAREACWDRGWEGCKRTKLRVRCRHGCDVSSTRAWVTCNVKKKAKSHQEGESRTFYTSPGSLKWPAN